MTPSLSLSVSALRFVAHPHTSHTLCVTSLRRRSPCRFIWAPIVLVPATLRTEKHPDKILVPAKDKQTRQVPSCALNAPKVYLAAQELGHLPFSGEKKKTHTHKREANTWRGERWVRTDKCHKGAPGLLRTKVQRQGR